MQNRSVPNACKAGNLSNQQFGGLPAYGSTASVDDYTIIPKLNRNALVVFWTSDSGDPRHSVIQYTFVKTHFVKDPLETHAHNCSYKAS